MPSFASSALLIARQASEIDQVKSTLSSWDSCMSKAYCKWPVIAAIVGAALIVLSILFCCFRCLCCGLECCCGCFSCCNACCPSPRGRRGGKYEPAPQQPYGPPPGYGYGYQPQAPMAYGALRSPLPQTATFDAPSSNSQLGADALPAMPSWQNAASRQVEDTSYHGVDDAHSEEDGIPLEHQLPATVSSPLNGDHVQHPTYSQPAQNYSDSQGSGAIAGGDLGRAQPHEYNNGYGFKSNEKNSPISPVQAPHSPAASSMYSTYPPPSYHTSGAPPPPTQQVGPQQNYSGYGQGASGSQFSPIQERSYTPYSHAQYQPFSPR